MKKHYIEPELEVVELLFEKMLAGVDNSKPEDFGEDGSELEL